MSNEELLAIIAIGLGGVALVAALVVAVRLHAARRTIAALQGRRKLSAGEADVLQEDIGRLDEALRNSVQCVGVVRFDAFEDMGGQLSFSAALLDGHGRGLVLTSINGRRETRIYAKPVEEGSSRYNLSDEEKEAIRRALATVAG
jgi:hypothetical protein